MKIQLFWHLPVYLGTCQSDYLDAQCSFEEKKTANLNRDFELVLAITSPINFESLPQIKPIERFWLVQALIHWRHHTIFIYRDIIEK